MSPTHVLLFETDLSLTDRVRDTLDSPELRLEVETSNQSGIHRVGFEPFDLVLIRWSPQAAELCDSLRRHRKVPIIALVEDAGDELLALEAGADDCLNRSMLPPLWRARIDAVVRRSQWPAFSREPQGLLVLDAVRHSVVFDHRHIELTPYEFSLLRILAEHAGQVLSREALMEQAKGSLDASFDRSIDVHMCRLRAKLGDRQRRQRVLRTVKGEGYMLVAAQVD